MRIIELGNGLHRRKRIRLTNEEAGLGAWLYLTYKIICNDEYDSIYEAKLDYLSEHGIYRWENGCLLCYKYHKDNCSKCPLYKAENRRYKIRYRNEGCDGGSYDNDRNDSYYWKTWHLGKYSHQERISACLKICEVLAKELKKSRKGKRK